MAIRRRFDDEPLPPQIFVDSSFIFEALLDARTNDGRHLECRRLLRRLVQSETQVLYSELIYVEAPQCWRRLWGRGVLGDPDAVPSESSRGTAFVSATVRLRQLLQAFHGYVAPLSSELADSASELAGYYNLRAQDAYLVALSRLSEVPDLVTLDRDFRRVDGLVVWSP